MRIRSPSKSKPYLYDYKSRQKIVFCLYDYKVKKNFFFRVPFFIASFLFYLYIYDCKGRLTKAWGLGGLDKAHSKLG